MQWLTHRKQQKSHKVTLPTITLPKCQCAVNNVRWRMGMSDGCLLMRPLMLKAKSSENFLSPKNGQILAVFGVWGSGVRKSFNFYCKRHICAWIHVVCGIPRENWLGVWPPGPFGGKKNKESNKHRIFHIFTQKPPLLRSSPNLFWGQISRT